MNGSPDARADVDALWSPTPNASIAATINPDFSQVEADVAQLDVNNRFTLNYPEKRPFFLEGAEFDETPLQTVFTRTISDPQAGARVSGKLGRTAVGAIVARDRVNHLLLPASQGSSTTSLNSGVVTTIGRVRRDIGASSTLGFLYTGREGAGYHNRLLGVDGFLQPAASVTLGFQLVRSHTDYGGQLQSSPTQPIDAFTGLGALVRGNYASRSRRGQVSAQSRSPGLSAGAGAIGGGAW